MQSKEKEILEAATLMVREGGYNAFSFRDIAKEVGVKSSSVHYHFPTKEILGAAVVTHYAEKFSNILGNPEDLVAMKKDPIEAYVNAFKMALIEDKRMCLCGILGAEIDGLPLKVAEETRLFFERNIDWLSKAYALRGFQGNVKTKAFQTLALLQGAVIASNVLKDVSTFERIAEAILSDD